MIKWSSGILSLVLLTSAAAKENDPVGLEVRRRSTIGALGSVRVQLTTKVQRDGSTLVTFNAPEAGSYVLIFTSGPEAGKVAMTVKVAKGGPVAAKLRPRGH